MPGPMELLIILAIIILLFGTKKLKNIGGDLGGAISSFKKSIKTGDEDGEDDTSKAISSKPSKSVVEEDKVEVVKTSEKSND